MPRLCAFDGCDKQPTFNTKGERKPLFCGEHKTSRMVDVKHPTCAFDGCDTRPSFNTKGERKGLFCTEHKEPGMIDVKNPTCASDGCDKKPHFNTKGERKGLFCGEHKKPGMVDVKKSTCAFDGCDKKPYFNTKGERKGLFCGEHKTSGMVDVKNPTCAFDGCDKQPTFNTKGERKPLFCGDHKTFGMVNVKNPTCAFDGCDTQPYFNTKGEPKGLFCGDHKEPGMVNVVSSTCAFDGCDTRPTFNTKGEPKGLFCGKHKTSGMVDVKNPNCAFDGCDKQPTFNTKGERKGLFCGEHKDPDMVDVKHPTCAFDGCDTRPGWGIPGTRATRCQRHQTEGMIRKPRTICAAKTCKEVAIYGLTVVRHCAVHRTIEEVPLIGGRCDRCHLVDILDERKLCATCDPTLHTRIRLAKQREVRSALDRSSTLRRYDLYDEKVDRGECGKERPDFAWDCGTHWLVLEVDEHQHKDRQETCECTRMVNLAGTFGMAVVFVRYNPDAYKPLRGKQAAFRHRIDVLERWLSHLMREPPQGLVTMIQLFFDGYSDESAKISTIVDWEKKRTLTDVDESHVKKRIRQ